MNELEKEIECMGSDTWPARERWKASVGLSVYLECHNDLYKYENRSLVINWCQEGVDPMEKIKLIVREIDFLSLCATSISEEYN